MSEANKAQVGGTHYVSDYQHWDFAAECYGAGYFKGVITKYVVRWRKKNGREDLLKARHYLVKLTELLNDCKLVMPATDNHTTTFAAANDLGIFEAGIVDVLTDATTILDLEICLALLDELLLAVPAV